MAELAATIGLACLGERDAAGNPLLAEDEAVLQSFEGVKLVLGADADQGEGKLFIMYRCDSGMQGAPDGGLDDAGNYAHGLRAVCSVLPQPHACSARLTACHRPTHAAASPG